MLHQSSDPLRLQCPCSDTCSRSDCTAVRSYEATPAGEISPSIHCCAYQSSAQSGPYSQHLADQTEVANLSFPYDNTPYHTPLRTSLEHYLRTQVFSTQSVSGSSRDHGNCCFARNTRMVSPFTVTPSSTTRGRRRNDT